MPFDAAPVVRSPLPDNIAGQSALVLDMVEFYFRWRQAMGAGAWRMDGSGSAYLKPCMFVRREIGRHKDRAPGISGARQWTTCIRNVGKIWAGFSPGSGWHRRALTSSRISTTHVAANISKSPTCCTRRRRWPRPMRGWRRRAMPPESCPYCKDRDIRRGEVITGACYGPNRIPPAGPRPRFIIYCSFCGCRTAVAGTWEEAEIWWAAGALPVLQVVLVLNVGACIPLGPMRGCRPAGVGSLCRLAVQLSRLIFRPLSQSRPTTAAKSADALRRSRGSPAV